MSKIEIVILIFACAIPLFSFFIVFKPKLKNLFKKKAKKDNKETKVEPVAETKVEEKQEEQIEIKPQAKEKTTRELVEDTFEMPDYMDFLKTKQKNTPAPMRKFLDQEFDLNNFDLEIPENKKDKPIAEQIQDLSPELKALLLSGVLDKRDF